MDYSNLIHIIQTYSQYYYYYKLCSRNFAIILGTCQLFESCPKEDWGEKKWRTLWMTVKIGQGLKFV